MKTIGIAATVAGVLVSGTSLLMKTSVHSEGDYRLGTYVPASDTLNIGLLQNQHLMFEAGLALFLAGVILLGAGAIIEALATDQGPSQVSYLVEQDAASSAAAPYAAAEAGSPTNKENTRLFYICSAVFLVVMLAMLFAIAQSSGPVNSAATNVENNGDELAARMEAQADNIDAVADNMLTEGSVPGQ